MMKNRDDGIYHEAELTESGIYKMLHDPERKLTIIATYKGISDENEDFTKRIDRFMTSSIMLKNFGLAYYVLQSRWIEGDEYFYEEMLAVQGLSYRKSIEIAKKFGRESFIFKINGVFKKVCCKEMDGQETWAETCIYTLPEDRALTVEEVKKILAASMPQDTAPCEGKYLSASRYELYDLGRTAILASRPKVVYRKLL